MGVFIFSPENVRTKKQKHNKAWCTIGTLVGAQPSPNLLRSFAFSISEEHHHPNSSCKLITISTAQNSIFLCSIRPNSRSRWKAGKKTSTPKLNIIIHAHPFGPLWMNKKNKQKITSTETLFKPSALPYFRLVMVLVKTQ